MTRILYTLFLFLFCLISQAQIQIEDSTLIPVDSCVRIGKLANGLTYYLRYNNWPENRACFYLVQRVGSIQEEESQRGLAHFLEHMCFNGSEHFEENAIEHFCESLGVDNGGGVNAYTSLEHTLYYIDNVPTTVGQERLDSCLFVMYDWANGLTLDSVEIEKERGIIHEEWRMGRDASERIMDRQLPKLYPNSKYGVRMPIGLMEVVDNFEHQQLRDYYEKWYNPENQCVVIVGDIDIEHVESKISELFGSIVPSDNAGIYTKEEVPDHKGIIYSIDQDKELQDNAIQVLYKHKAYTPEERKYVSFWKDAYLTNSALYMLNYRLYDESLKEESPFLSASADDDDYIYSSTKAAFSLNATTKDGMEGEALTAIVKECRRAAEFGFTKEEYSRYTAEQISTFDNLLMSADKRESAGLAEECYNNYLYGTDMSSIEDYVAIWKTIVKNTSLEDINKRMHELLPEIDDNAAIICWSVEKDSIDYPTEQQLYSALQSGRCSEIEPYIDKLKDAKLYAKKPKKGKIVKEEHFDDIDYTKLTLSNGAKVYIKHTEIEKSQVLFRAYGEGGWSLYSEKDDPNINLFNSISFSNNGLSTSDIGKLLLGKRVSLLHSLQLRNFTFTGSANPNDLETLMELIYADFTCQSNDYDTFRNLMDETRIALENRKTIPEAAFEDSVSVTGNGHHPRYKLTTLEDLDSIDIERELEIFKEQTSNAAGYSFLFVGNYDETTIRPLIERYIASLPSNKKSVKQGHFIRTWLNEDVLCHFEREMETPKSMVNIDWYSEAFPYTFENKLYADIACRVLNMVYSKVVREENSAAYDCSANSYLARGEEGECQTGFSAYCSMKPEMCDSVITLMKSEFYNLSEHIDEVMFNNAKESMLVSFDEMIKTKNGFWLDAIWQKERYGLDTYSSRKAFIQSMTIDSLKAFMKQQQSTSHQTEVLMQPKS